uniref:Ubiquitin conjugating enzyme E2 L6 n=1 Tax=Gallus gallus TaxID=9031 RepID=A0A8V1A5S3_CHICK
MSRRLAMELEEVRRWGGVRDLQLVDRDVLRWRGLLLPNNPPYNAGAFRFELVFSPHYPLVPPRVTLLTGIHHPGVGPDGTVCQPIASPESWEPLTRITHGRCWGPGVGDMASALADAPPVSHSAAGPAAAAGQPQHRAGAAPRAGPRAEREARGLPAPGRGAHPSLRRAASRHPRALSPHLGAPRPVHKAPT